MMKILFYDLDGTLADTRRDIACAANHMLTTLERPAKSQKEIEQYVGRGLYYLIQGCLETEDAKTVERGSRIYREYYAAHMLDHTRLYEGVRETLEHFRDRTQVVVTNKPDPFTRDMLRELGVADYFYEIVPGNGRYPKKPDPAAVLAVLEAKGAAPEAAVFVGDSPVDIETGRRAGIRTVAISHGFTPENDLKSAAPDVLLPDFQAFLAYARENGW